MISRRYTIHDSITKYGIEVNKNWVICVRTIIPTIDLGYTADIKLRKIIDTTHIHINLFLFYINTVQTKHLQLLT